MRNFQNAAATYIDMGWAVIPLQPKDKRPFDGYKWKDENLTSQTLYGFPKNSNVGVILGKRSNHLIDIDFDIPEAGIMGQMIFSNLPSFGRKSAPYGHKIVICKDAQKTQQYKLTQEQADMIGLTEKAVVLELRANGGQTMFPPSTHPSGEVVQWRNGLPKEIPHMDFEKLQKLCGLCAFLAVILKKYPTVSGARDEICLTLAGALLRAEIPPDMVDDLIVYIAQQKGDEEADKRKKAEVTKQKLDAGEDVTGLPRLCELLGISELQSLLSKWLYGTTAPSGAHDEVSKAIAEINMHSFVIRNEGGKCLVGSFESQPLGKGVSRDTLVTQNSSDFKSWFANRQVLIGYTEDRKPKFMPLGKLWWEHPDRRQYERVVFAPELEVPEDLLNLWRGYGVKAIKGKWRRMQRHIWRVLAKGDRNTFRYIIMWSAWAVQNPGEPAEVALVLRGGKGTGKGTFLNALVLIFGHHGLAISSSMHLTGRFNAHMRDCVLLFADEAVVPNDKKAEGILKALITEPRLMIEGKNKDPIPCVNHLHIVMASNDDWVISASADERRYAVFDISDERAQDESWFGPLNAELANGGLEAMLYFFKNLDLKGWHPRKNIPASDALRNQQIHSLKGMEMLWFDYLSTGEADGDGNNGNVAIPTEYFAKKAGVSKKSSGEFLKRMGCTHNRNTRPTTWVTPPLSEARKIWDSTMFPVEWHTETEWAPVPIPPLKTPF